jgi:hypothetical protein
MGDTKVLVSWGGPNHDTHSATFAREEVDEHIRSGHWKVIPDPRPALGDLSVTTQKLGNDLVSSHEREPKAKVGGAQGALPLGPPRAARGYEVVAFGGGGSLRVSAIDRTKGTITLEPDDVGVPGGVPCSGVGIQSEADPPVVQFTREQFCDAVRLACEAGIEDYVEARGIPTHPFSCLLLEIADALSERADVAWEDMRAEAALQAASEPVAEECDHCGRALRTVFVSFGTGWCDHCLTGRALRATKG